MKHSLCPKNSSWDDDSNDTKNETENRILPSVVLRQSFVKNIGEFPGSPWTFLKTHLVVKGLNSNSRSIDSEASIRID